ncbi:CHAD domain-containing protein [Fibrella aquatilis]|uniref:CHAD domain-containing protein n=1 Tax=Fibrella aquatilis TaxID=2817059 RepID=A0A939G781_9BACT|nr:CHAD domain-containing protein [Fibrella aquatilis]MBO0933151.1 CHAD domain-containing protein [Fibrella aquatilis]
MPEEAPALYDFYAHRTHSLVERVDAARRHPTDEHIRRVRVGIKRLRSLYKLIAMIRPRAFKRRRHKQALRKLFKRAGQVRDIQVSQAALPRLSVPVEVKKAYRLFLEKRENKARKKLQKALVRFHKKALKPTTRLIRRLSKKTNPATIDRRLRAFIDQEAAAIYALQQAEPSPERVHEARKQLKSLVEVGTLLMQLTPDDALATVLTNAKQLQAQIGHWHDSIVLLHHLEAFIAQDHHLPISTAERLIARQQQLANHQEQRIGQFNDSLHTLVEALSPWRVADVRTI